MYQYRDEHKRAHPSPSDRRSSPESIDHAHAMCGREGDLLEERWDVKVVMGILMVRPCGGAWGVWFLSARLISQEVEILYRSNPFLNVNAGDGMYLRCSGMVLLNAPSRHKAVRSFREYPLCRLVSS